VDHARFPAVTVRHFLGQSISPCNEKNVKAMNPILPKNGFDRFATGQFHILIIFLSIFENRKRMISLFYRLPLQLS